MTTKSSKTPYLLRGQTLRSTGLFQMDTPIQYQVSNFRLHKKEIVKSTLPTYADGC